MCDIGAYNKHHVAGVGWDGEYRASNDAKRVEQMWHTRRDQGHTRAAGNRCSISEIAADDIFCVYYACCCCCCCCCRCLLFVRVRGMAYWRLA